jgi:hypothetical protein
MLIIKSRKQRALKLDEPLKHGSHKRPTTRRDFLAQGFLTGAATVVAPTLLGTLMNPKMANALSTDVQDVAVNVCKITAGAGKIPFICFDLAGGANIAGSNVLVGKAGGQMDFLSTQGYSKLGLPPTMLPNNPTFVNTEFGLAFHSDSAFLRGMQARTAVTTRANVSGTIIAARSENDTGNNPHNPMYGLAKYGSKGELLTLIGSQNSDSGGNSMAPAMLMDTANRPTKVDRASDVTGLVDTGELGTLFRDPRDTVAVMESIYRISKEKMDRSEGVGALPDEGVRTGLTGDAAAKSQFKCGYVKTADTIEKFNSPAALNPLLDTDILGPTGIFPGTSFSDGEYGKIAAIMKLVVNGYAGAGTASMGGFDYHTGDRSTGEARDFRAGECIGAALEYAARRQKPLMVYVFSDGSLSASNMVDNSTGGRGKNSWQGDNQGTAAAFFLVYNPTGRPTLLDEGGIPAGRRQQIGYFTEGGDNVASSNPAGNSVNNLVYTILLNYMALHGESASFSATFPTQGLGDATTQRSLISFNPIVNGKIGG